MSPTTSTTTRPNHAPRARAEVSALRARPTADVVIIGGGIIGVSTALFLA